MVISISGGKYWLWQAVDNEGDITLDQFYELAERCAKSSCGQYVLVIHRSFAKSRFVEL